jgi:hypothetical protein
VIVLLCDGDANDTQSLCCSVGVLFLGCCVQIVGRRLGKISDCKVDFLNDG